ncbi:MAG TPA: hypothetical protein VHW91_09170 [Candidatus Dormibacteraeota bacterium]|jgi:hypothetical protein|nr:hypothetical protein [Candidatus Dormibacteraeota bacterium]
MARGDPPFKFENLLPYYNGAYYASVAIKGRLAAAGQVEAAREVTAYQEMLVDFRKAITETHKLRQERAKAAG